MIETLIVKFNAEEFGEPILTVGRVNTENEQIRLVANYRGETALDVYKILTYGGKVEESEEVENA